LSKYGVYPNDEVMIIKDMLFIYAIAVPVTMGVGIATYLHFKELSDQKQSVDPTNSWIIITLFVFGITSFTTALFWKHNFE